MTARFVRAPAARARALAVATEVLERIPLPMCVAREPGPKIELANSAFCRLTRVERPTGTAIRDGFAGTVIDTGIGIERDLLPRIFDRFVRAPDASRWSAGGLGLGLHIVRWLVREHGGSIDVYSDGPGRGSTFTIRLPCAAMIEREAREEDCRSRADAS